MILEAKDSCNKLSFTWLTKTTREWKIQVNELELTFKNQVQLELTVWDIITPPPPRKNILYENHPSLRSFAVSAANMFLKGLTLIELECGGAILHLLRSRRITVKKK